MFAFVSLLSLVAIAATAPSAFASRRAVVIGANQGDLGEERLAYAEADAVRFAEVLTHLGGVAPEDLVLLTGARPPAVAAALKKAATRGADGSSVLFIYYSGHADAQDLHLGGAHLGFHELRRIAKEAHADVTVFVIDACRSGGLTRVKGGRPAAPFDLAPEGPLGTEGVAVLTSAAESEDAQESDRLRGGIFTHHLVNGLTGAADTSGDQEVTLSEAYQYAYGQTLRSTTTAPTLQHPTFDIDYHGHAELVLTWTREIHEYTRVRFEAPGHYLVFDDLRPGTVAAELDAIAGTGLLLAPGRYLVRRRTADVVSERTFDLVAGGERRIAAGDLAPVPFRETVRRGMAEPTSTFAIGAGMEVSGPLLPALAPTVAGVLAGQLDFADVALQVRLRYGRGTSENATLATNEQLLGLDLTALHAFDLSRGLAFALGLRAGGDWYRQSFDSHGVAPTRDQLVGRLAPLARLEWAPWADVLVYVDGGAEIYLLQAQAEGGDDAGATARTVPFGSLGFYVRWP